MNATLVLIILCFLSYGLVLAAYSSGMDINNIFDNYGFSGNNAFAKPWTFFTCIFLHADIGHLLSNMVVLLFFGTSVENELGKGKMLIIFFVGAILGEALSIFFYPPNVISIGASAGVFALIGTGMLVKPFDLSFYPFLVPMPLGIIGILYAVYNSLGMMSGLGNISYIAHFGGMLFGLLVGFRHEGFKRGLKTIIIMFAIMLILPLLASYVLSLWI